MNTTLKLGNVEATARSFGGELISYKKDGKEYVWTGDPVYWNGVAPACFPFVSALKDGKAIIDGKECTMPSKHGFVRDSELTLIEQTENKVVYELTESEKTLENYPFKFSFKVTHEISENGFSTTYTVKNTDSKVLPFCSGGHPGFLIEDGIENYKLVFECEEDADIGYTDSKSMYSDDYVLEGKRLVGKEWELCYKDFDVDAIFFKNIKSKKVAIVEKATGKVHLNFDFTGFAELIVWTWPGKRAPYLCLEPWNGLPALVGESGIFEEKPHMTFLEPGKEYSVGYKVEL
ncbi:MAG: aldose 1-epimerase family protein [Clostridia bacterium]|nr:aldose 1-epimerase family protein [Clostridia bacterium]